MVVCKVQFLLMGSDLKITKRKLKKYMKRMLVWRGRIKYEQDDPENDRFFWYISCDSFKQIKHLTTILSYLHTLTDKVMTGSTGKIAKKKALRKGISADEWDNAQMIISEGKDIEIVESIEEDEWKEYKKKLR